jgi:hypothetical protein
MGHPNKKINKEILELNDTINQKDLTDVYRIFHPTMAHPTMAQYTFFSAAHGTLSKIDYIFGHKASLSKYKKIEITLCILSDHSALKLELNPKATPEHANNWKLNTTLLNDQLVIAEIREEIKCFLEANENQNTTKAVLRRKFIAVRTYVKRSERSKINDLMLHLKLLEKQEQAKHKTSRRREIRTIGAEINEIETKKTIQRINETKC